MSNADEAAAISNTLNFMAEELGAGVLRLKARLGKVDKRLIRLDKMTKEEEEPATILLMKMFRRAKKERARLDAALREVEEERARLGDAAGDDAERARLAERGREADAGIKSLNEYTATKIDAQFALVGRMMRDRSREIGRLNTMLKKSNALVLRLNTMLKKSNALVLRLGKGRKGAKKAQSGLLEHLRDPRGWVDDLNDDLKIMEGWVAEIDDELHVKIASMRKIKRWIEHYGNPK